jgi:hypothetical protein
MMEDPLTNMEPSAWNELKAIALDNCTIRLDSS